MMTRLHLDFFHDVVCCWCYNISSRLRRLSAECNLEIRHRTFVLQADSGEMTARWGTPDQARATILGHWAACREVSDTPEGIRIDAMRAAAFDYPHGGQAALACKAAERIGGQPAHWAMFDALQRAHLTEARNIAAPEVLATVAQEIGLAPAAFREGLADPRTAALVEADRHHARALQIRSIPSVIVRETGQRLVNGPMADLRAQLRAAARLAA
ncbi:DsbA family protein [Salipiger sp. P9]|uniref:DsbA family oxidoreductase n=1 Tax=Salipiger pentaromativorans TaxID=2943193 RepID=UPI00215875E9|nr:DsbA family protein [Salipiger pentaromativorans]MCR8546864.1 DsbA family protein [Salipiger pentaromativorans]